jgi:uncharacterized protein DUF4184
MPFTLAHPAAVLPLMRLRALDALPLIIGSVTPDIGYYLPQRISFHLPQAHSLAGSLSFCLPVALVLLATLVALQIPLIEPLPTEHRQFVASLIERFQSRKLYLAAAVPSILIGVWTHIIWDSFTHRNRWVVQHSTLLRMNLQAPMIGPVEVFRVLQYVSSAVGLVILIIAYISAERRFVRGHRPADVQGKRAVLLGLLLAMSGAITAGEVMQLRHFSFDRLGFVALTSGAVFGVLWFVSGLVLVTLRRLTNPAA